MTMRGCTASAVVGLLDEVVQHFLGDLKSAMTPSFMGLNGHDVAGSLRPSIFFCLLCPRPSTSLGVLVDGHDGRLVDNDALAGSAKTRCWSVPRDGRFDRNIADSANENRATARSAMDNY